MIQSIYVNNFKSLRECRLDLDKLTCLVGLNGSGKSTLLQACGFIAAVMAGKEESWLAERRWTWKDVCTQIPGENDSALLHFSVNFKPDKGSPVRWWCRYNAAQHRCTEERLYLSTDGQRDKAQTVLWLQNRRAVVAGKTLLMEQVYSGSVLSSLQDKHLTPECLAMRQAVSSLQAFDLLSPQGMRASSRIGQNVGLGADGGQIAAFIAAMSDKVKAKLLERLQAFFPSVMGFRIRKKQGGDCELRIRQRFGTTEIETEARQCSDGLLRVLGILAALHGPQSLVCFDEIENGISFDLTAAVADELAASGKQILVTTHDMLLVNCLPQASVRLVVKKDGLTHVVPFNKVPVLLEKSKIFNAGDALLSMSLEDISQAALQAISA